MNASSTARGLAADARRRPRRRSADLGLRGGGRERLGQRVDGPVQDQHVPGRGALDERGGQLEADLVAVLVDRLEASDRRRRRP
jgi:hypothetical protein